MPEMNPNANNNLSGMEQLSTEELERLIRQDFYSDNGDGDTELILRALEVLAQRRADAPENDAPVQEKPLV